MTFVAMRSVDVGPGVKMEFQRSSMKAAIVEGGRVERAVSECLGVWSGLGRASRADEGCVGLESALGGVGEGVY